MNRDEAWALLNEYTKSESLLKHALAVEAAMRHYAAKRGENAEQWGVTGLLHDFDYERWPDAENHPFCGSKILRVRGYSEFIIRAILSHADYSGVARESRLEHTLFACDEMAGFVTAAALVPIELPTSMRVKGMIATTRMMNGTDRVALTTSPSTLLIHGADSSSPRCEVARNSPKGRPSSVPRSAEMATM